MLSRQTLGRPGENGLAAGTLNNRAMQGGATIVTQFNRDNLDEEGVACGNDEIDDLRRE